MKKLVDWRTMLSVWAPVLAVALVYMAVWGISWLVASGEISDNDIACSSARQGLGDGMCQTMYMSRDRYGLPVAIKQ